VTAPLGVLEAESTAHSTVIPNDYVVNLPLNGRNFIDLALLAPGVVPSAEGSAGSARGRFAFQSNGGREDANSYLFDGVYAIDPVLNSISLSPSVDAIQEFRIQTSNADAGFGRQSGGQVAVLLKRGGNDLHGSLYEFFRNDVLDARNFFTDPGQPTPKLRRNQFGVSSGGPLRKNRSFFFADYEGLRERRVITRTTNVPTAAERMGDFSQSALPPPIDAGAGPGHLARKLAMLGPCVIAVDSDPAALIWARQHEPGDGMGPNTPRLVRGSVMRFPLTEGCVDGVAGASVAGCLTDLEGFLRESCRVLRPGGHLVLTATNATSLLLRVNNILRRIERRRPESAAERRRYRLYHPAEMIASLRATGFEPIRLRFFNYVLNAGPWLLPAASVAVRFDRDASLSDRVSRMARNFLVAEGTDKGVGSENGKNRTLRLF